MAAVGAVGVPVKGGLTRFAGVYVKAAVTSELCSVTAPVRELKLYTPVEIAAMLSCTKAVVAI